MEATRSACCWWGPARGSGPSSKATGSRSPGSRPRRAGSGIRSGRGDRGARRSRPPRGARDAPAQDPRGRRPRPHGGGATRPTGAVAMHAGAEDHLVRGSIADGLLPRAIRYAVDRRRLRRELATIDETHAAAQPPRLRRDRRAPAADGRSGRHAGRPALRAVRRSPRPRARGPGAADELAVEAAEVLLSAIRDADLPARIADDTFCVLLSGDARGSEVAVLSRLVEAIAVHDATSPSRGRSPCRSAARSTTRPIPRASRACSNRRSRHATALIRAPMTREYLPRPSGSPGGGIHERIDDDRTRGGDAPMRSA